MKIVVDTNVVVAALIRAGIVRELLLGYPGIWLIPASCVEEAWETHRDWNRKGIDEAIIREALDLLAKRVLIVVPEPVFHSRMDEAARLIADADDIPVVALALSVDNAGIWTFNTRDFVSPKLTARVRVLTTRDVGFLLRTTL